MILLIHIYLKDLFENLANQLVILILINFFFTPDLAFFVVDSLMLCEKY